MTPDPGREILKETPSAYHGKPADGSTCQSREIDREIDREFGGKAEVEAARWAKDHCRKPIAGSIAGATAPPGRRMGHAGAIIGGAEDTAQAKKQILAGCGIAVAETPSEMARTLLDRWGK